MPIPQNASNGIFDILAKLDLKRRFPEFAIDFSTDSPSGILKVKVKIKNYCSESHFSSFDMPNEYEIDNRIQIEVERIKQAIIQDYADGSLQKEIEKKLRFGNTVSVEYGGGGASSAGIVGSTVHNYPPHGTLAAYKTAIDDARLNAQMTAQDYHIYIDEFGYPNHKRKPKAPKKEPPKKELPQDLKVSGTSYWDF